VESRYWPGSGKRLGDKTQALFELLEFDQEKFRKTKRKRKGR
jgi:hypothetical protein